MPRSRSSVQVLHMSYPRPCACLARSATLWERKLRVQYFRVSICRSTFSCVRPRSAWQMPRDAPILIEIPGIVHLGRGPFSFPRGAIKIALRGSCAVLALSCADLVQVLCGIFLDRVLREYCLVSGSSIQDLSTDVGASVANYPRYSQ
jgi:hypothetical protein